MLFCRNVNNFIFHSIKHVRFCAKDSVFVGNFTALFHSNCLIGWVGRVFTNCPGDRGSIAGWVIPKTFIKWYLIPPCLTLSIIRYVSRVKWSNPREGVAPSPRPRCSSYWKVSLRVTFGSLLITVTNFTYYFIKKKSASEAHRILVETYGKHALLKTTCRNWFKHLKNNDFDVEDKERSGALKTIEESKPLLYEDSFQSQAELTESLRVDHTSISKHLKMLGMIQKQGHWVLYKLKSRNIE